MNYNTGLTSIGYSIGGIYTIKFCTVREIGALYVSVFQLRFMQLGGED